jgi:hypothetical protein
MHHARVSDVTHFTLTSSDGTQLISASRVGLESCQNVPLADAYASPYSTTQPWKL